MLDEKCICNEKKTELVTETNFARERYKVKK